MRAGICLPFFFILLSFVIPAKAGIQFTMSMVSKVLSMRKTARCWTPVFAGVTGGIPG